MYNCVILICLFFIYLGCTLHDISVLGNQEDVYYYHNTTNKNTNKQKRERDRQTERQTEGREKNNILFLSGP